MLLSLYIFISFVFYVAIQMCGVLQDPRLSVFLLNFIVKFWIRFISISDPECLNLFVLFINLFILENFIQQVFLNCSLYWRYSN